MSSPVLFSKGSALAIDWGLKKIGFATTDCKGFLVTPQKVYFRKKDALKWTPSSEDIKHILKIVEDYDIEHIIMGIPLARDSSHNEASEQTLQLKKVLEVQLDKPINLVDEHLSSWEASKKVKGKEDDSVAAALLLEDFINMQKRNFNNSGFIKFGTLAILLILFLLSVTGYVHWKVFHRKINLKQTTIVGVPNGESYYSLLSHLKDKGVRISRIEFKYYHFLTGQKPELKVGEYAVKPKMTRAQILENFNLAKSIQYSLTLKEGDNIWITDTVLSNALNAKEDSWAHIKNTQLLVEHGIFKDAKTAKSGTLEGFLFPNTYSYDSFTSKKKLISLMLQEFKARALPILKRHPWGATDEGIYKLVTLASIVEKESGNFKEQPIIASVFWNRIKKGMMLQSDPTIIYPLFPDFDGDIKRFHIREKNQYNTYRMKGLPLGPIANPGLSAIKAVVTPYKTDFLFFVAKGNGLHAFSKDYETHRRYVREYQLKQKR